MKHAYYVGYARWVAASMGLSFTNDEYEAIGFQIMGLGYEETKSFIEMMARLPKPEGN